MYLEKHWYTILTKIWTFDSLNIPHFMPHSVDWVNEEPQTFKAIWKFSLCGSNVVSPCWGSIVFGSSQICHSEAWRIVIFPFKSEKQCLVSEMSQNANCSNLLWSCFNFYVTTWWHHPQSRLPNLRRHSNLVNKCSHWLSLQFCMDPALWDIDI